MAGLNPLENTHSHHNTHPVSQKTFPIAGILTTVYGLDELPPDIYEVACVWLLHPRLQTKNTMDAIASQLLYTWDSRKKAAEGSTSHLKGLIAVSFDQRNHGSRLVDKVANEAWRNGNPRHAQDMFSCYHGTAQDTSLLLSYLPAYAFPTNSHRIMSNFVLGVSLGGHAAWHCILFEPRITAAVIVIGCPDYTSVMTHRAEKSKLRTWTETSPPGSEFLGSPDFPPALMEAIRQWDPASYLSEGNKSEEVVGDLKHRFSEKVKQHLSGKRILNLSGGADKLVPYSAGRQFLKNLKESLDNQDDTVQDAIHFEDVIYDGVGHQMTTEMSVKAVDFLCKAMNGGKDLPVSNPSSERSKI
ncbi:hypothetical protein EJ05DRAFT_471488 [Pseudovirgaria hyperparasitica]|uniref:Alpha/beta-hydrolase n=1 Tax=Pseudovirgaria hyperparasitica TaxID=470096 RepID=A0A6A6WJL2_9PEZI|nr:uncharacterized protein EJ05DRAFT_471488 [Pseudovirgaria hyperparasitica]KAF2762474.1 hypothetical protein EJ05DRAFT_471488 [Pseudovirgaria hyperparasitica]